MARGKFNKRGGGPRLDAVNAQEIEQRNARLAELEEQRAQRRAEAEEDEQAEEGAEGDGKNEAEEAKEDTEKAGPKKNDAPAAPVTTEADHRRNMAKLAEVRKRREEAEAKRKAEEELAKQQEEERKKLAAMILEEDEDDSKKKKKKKENSIPKLDKITIKKMKPAQMKEALKARGLDIQGNAKALQERLLKYEQER